MMKFICLVWTLHLTRKPQRSVNVCQEPCKQGTKLCLIDYFNRLNDFYLHQGDFVFMPPGPACFGLSVCQQDYTKPTGPFGNEMLWKDSLGPMGDCIKFWYRFRSKAMGVLPIGEGGVTEGHHYV